METDLERSLKEAAEDHSTQALALTANAARAQGWRVVAVVEEEVRPGTRQHGYAVVSRTGSQFLLPDEERAFAVLTWIYRHEDGTVFFEAGEYDLTRGEALARFTNRSKLMEQALASNFAAALAP